MPKIFGAPQESDSEVEEKLGFVPVETTPEEAYAEKVRAASEKEGEEETEEVDEQSSVSAEALEVIAARMKSLTQSLNNMPQPPAFKNKINLPGDGIARGEENREEQKETP